MRLTLAALLLTAAFTLDAQPTVTSIEPPFGYTFRETIVTIHGTGFSHTDFECDPQNMSFCPAQVFFGPNNMNGTVLRATPTTLTVRVGPRPHGEGGPVRVRLRDGSEAVLASGFRWDVNAVPSDPAEYYRFLIPVTPQDVYGANGSLWSTDWIVRSHWHQAFSGIWHQCPPNVSPCPNRIIAPNTTLHLPLVPRGDGADGAFVYIPKPMWPSMALRVRDLSQNAQSFGTELPIIRDSDYRSDMSFLEIPTDPKYRATLRIYGNGPEPHMVIVGVVSEDTGALIESYDVELSGVVHAVPEPFPLHPAYAQLDPLTPAVRASGKRVRIGITSRMWWSLISPPPSWPAWAFVTVTNNETQQTTTITPKP